MMKFAVLSPVRSALSVRAASVRAVPRARLRCACNLLLAVGHAQKIRDRHRPRAEPCLRRSFPRRPAATRRDCRRVGRAATCRIRDGGSCRGSAAQDAVRGRKTPFGTTSPPAAEFRQEPLSVDTRLLSDSSKFLSFLFHVFPRHSPRICRISHTSPHSAH